MYRKHFGRHLVCLQIISNMFSLSLVARSTELNLHAILAVAHVLMYQQLIRAFFECSNLDSH